MGGDEQDQGEVVDKFQYDMLATTRHSGGSDKSMGINIS